MTSQAPPTLPSYWLTPTEDQEFLEAASQAPLPGVFCFGAACWLWVIAHVSTPDRRPDDNMVSEGIRKTLWAQAAVTAIHSISAIILGASLLYTQTAQQACTDRVFCWSSRLFLSMESQLGYVLFESIFSAFKAKRFLLPLGAAEDLMLMLMLLMQRVYPCAAVNTIFPWVCIMRGAALFWAAEDLLRSSQRRSWNWIFINEMLRTTAAAAKLILSVLLAWQVGQWMREQQLPGYALPHGLDTWSWPYSYVTVASLCFMVFIALKQLQGAVKATQRTIKEYERLAQPAQAGQGKARTQTAKEDTVSNKRSGPRRVLKR